MVFSGSIDLFQWRPRQNGLSPKRIFTAAKSDLLCHLFPSTAWMNASNLISSQLQISRLSKAMGSTPPRQELWVMFSLFRCVRFNSRSNYQEQACFLANGNHFVHCLDLVIFLITQFLNIALLFLSSSRFSLLFFTVIIFHRPRLVSIILFYILKLLWKVKMPLESLLLSQSLLWIFYSLYF